MRSVDWTGVVNLAPEKTLNKPYSWRKSEIVFVNSMSDMFHENVPDEYLMRIWPIMIDTPQHEYQILTKRASRMAFKTRELRLKWAPNMWAGVTIEEDKYAIPRVRELLKVPAALRFVSAEPLLSALPSLDVASVDWVISGGESGSNRGVRSSDPDWHRDLRDRCRAAGTPFFFKQWGAYNEKGNRAGKHQNGSLLDGEIIHEMPARVFDACADPRSTWTRVVKPTIPSAIEIQHHDETYN